MASEMGEVREAFEILLEEVENTVNTINQGGASAFQRGDYNKASSLIAQAKSIADFRNKIKQLQSEWVQTCEPSVQRKAYGRLAKGLRTPEEEFRISILKTLIKFGGSANTDQVITEVGKIMAENLNEYDLQPLPSLPDQPRWKNTVHWARRSMVDDRLITSDSPRGVWKVTQAGREWLGVQLPKSSQEQSIENQRHLKNLTAPTTEIRQNSQLVFETKGVVAYGQYRGGDQFHVRKGSQAVGDQAVVPSCPGKYRQKRDQLIKEGALLIEDDHYVFAQDYIFSSPSEAASVVAGNS